MALLGNYGFQSLSEDEFEFNFEIPTNCNYTTDYDSEKNINTISIQLNSGQSQPASTYNTETYTLNSVNSLLDVVFQQTLNGVTSTKPRVVITN
ncbi:hypothetical protein FLJC2902T_26230 [Flavobacterium limnosediminis JC2902]|uniref:Uncharacterized protein n=1 Tax=Flavobacterium limnosediminis JC2902 TaxID=1341181 RepID=V6SJ12_9FLAO|nr:hypothetical protein [Flavobacterium limnosediminis]ESU26648.1 hypothetical protein FLJC2902T_26230 [Flavobacterium limnosediminis JC2902]